MDDLTFSAKRASAATPAPDLDARFRALVQSPLRAGSLRYLSARPDESFGWEERMQTCGRVGLDVENCARELVDFGVAEQIPGDPPRYMHRRTPQLAELIDQFMERRATGSSEDKSPSATRVG